MHWPSRAKRALLLASVAALACGGAPGRSVRVVVPQGASFRAAADSLAKAGVIRAPALFRLYAKLRGGDRRIKAGTYLLRRGSSWNGVLTALREGKGLMFTVTIPEGYTLSQIVPLVARVLEVPADSVIAAARDTAHLHRLGVPTPTLEGYLFPDTYMFLPGTPARVAVGAMVRRFEQVWRPEWTSRLDTVRMTRHQVMTLASIVEREAKRPDERPVIAGVYRNRLRSGMRLEADPTVQYARGIHTNRVLFKDLDVESPYNTYKHAGLPPGPIASPGAASLRAALYPADVPYKFFVAYPDGRHEFTVDFAQHTAARRKALREWNALEARRDSAAAAATRGGAR
jgi:peptidoglycan lytic transglycosylase G